eukprot:COSAG06_NODE_3410_length_5383_cov_180.550530_8_plen_54_part_00
MSHKAAVDLEQAQRGRYDERDAYGGTTWTPSDTGTAAGYMGYKVEPALRKVLW